MTLDHARKIDCTWDGTTVWVNMSGAAIARFGRFGIDIHQLADVTIETGRVCLYCTHETATAESWEMFCTKMREFYNLVIPAQARPERLKVTSLKPRSSVSQLDQTFWPA